MLDAFFASFVTIFLAELGDKSRLVAFTLSARYKAPLPVFAGMTLSYLLLDGIAVVFGSLIGRRVHQVHCRRFFHIVRNIDA